MARDGFVGIDTIEHRGAIAGRVLDALTQLPLAGAQVAITDGPAAFTAKLAALQEARPSLRPDLTVADRDGVFRWLDLPAGAYTLQASSDGRYAAQGSASSTVVAGTPSFVAIQLAPTALTGTVQASGGQPLAMAKVRLVDSDEVAYSDENGLYTLSPVEPGSGRAIEVSAQSYTTATASVTLARGATTSAATVVLARATT